MLVGIVLLVLGIALIAVGIDLSFPSPCPLENGVPTWSCNFNNEGVGLALGISGGLSLLAGIITIIIGAVLAVKRPLESAFTGLVWGKDCRYCHGKIRVGLRKCPNCGAPT